MDESRVGMWILFMLMFIVLFIGGYIVERNERRRRFINEWDKKWKQPDSGWAYESLLEPTCQETGMTCSRLISIEPKLHKWFFSSVDQYKRPLDGVNRFNIGPASAENLADHIIAKGKKAAAPTQRILEHQRAKDYAVYYSDCRGW